MEHILKEEETKGFAMARENDKRAGMMTFSIALLRIVCLKNLKILWIYLNNRSFALFKYLLIVNSIAAA